jgi:type IV pilus assembly protein PilY1
LGTCPDTPVDLHHVRFIWSAGEWLSQLSDVDVSVNRSPYLSDANRRYIYTWNDLNNDGIVDRSAGADNEWLPFVAGTNWRSLPVSNDRNPVPVDFDVVTPDVIPSPTALPLQATADAKVDDIVNWIRGIDRPDAADLNDNGAMVDDGETPRRSRLMPIADGSATKITARLGDVIHSTPMTVSSPAEGYHLIYNDFSYAEFVKHYKNRRHVIYFGGNDGMLHAVNGGFYDEKQKKFCTGSTYDSNGLCEDNPSMPALGAELWAYVPYNLLPHLGSLTQPDYKHKYFVDLRPRIFDAQIFPAGTDTNGINHPNGWGTILVGGMRLGGAPIEARELNGSHLEPDDKRQFISAYFIFDITDPEQPPVLLGEMTRLTDAAGNSDEADLGHSLAIPTMVVMKQNGAATQTDTNKWYLLFGSGPQAALGSNKAMKAVSDQNAKVAVLPLDWLVKSPTALRIPSTTPTEGNPAGTFELLDAPKGFTSDLITVDLDINPSSSSYYSDAVYFGTVEGDFAAKTVGSSTYTYWNGGGRAYRLITRNQESGKYLHGKGIAPTITAPHEWAMTTLLDAGQPVSATPNVGYDGNNFWVYFGTGRFFDVNDKTDDTQQSYYGIKEPMEATTTPGVKEWLASAVTAPLATAHGAPPTEITARTWPAETAGQGEKGLLKVDEIRVAEAGTTDPTRLSCRGGGTDCLPPSMVTANATKFTDLVNYLAKPDPSGGDPNNLYNSADGWYVDFFPYGNRERNVGQATLFGGLVTFTTYQPFLDACQAEGKAYLYALQYQTGTAWTQKIFGEYGLYEDNTSVREKLDLGRGLATTPNLHVSGDGDSVTAMVQTSTGVIEEIKLDNMATDDYFTGRAGWKECSP